MSLIDQYFRCEDENSFSEKSGDQLLNYVKNIIQKKRNQLDNNIEYRVDKDFTDLIHFLHFMPNIKDVEYSSMNIVQKLHYICLFTHKILKREKYYTNIPQDSFEKEFYFLQEYILSDIILYKYHVLTSHSDIYTKDDIVETYLRLQGFSEQPDFDQNFNSQKNEFKELYRYKLSDNVLDEVISNNPTQLNYLTIFYKEFVKTLPNKITTYKNFTEKMDKFFLQKNDNNFLDFLYLIQMRLGNISFPDVLERKIILSSLNDNLDDFLKKFPRSKETLHKILEKNQKYTRPVGSSGPIGPISSSNVDSFDDSRIKIHFYSEEEREKREERDEREETYFDIIRIFEIYTYPLFIDIYRSFEDTEKCGTLCNIFINKDVEQLRKGLFIIYSFLERGKNYTDENFEMGETEKNFFADNFHLYSNIFVPHAKQILSNPDILNNDELKEDLINLSAHRLTERKKKKKKKKKTGLPLPSVNVTKELTDSSITFVDPKEQVYLPQNVGNTIYKKSKMSSSKPTIDMTGFYQMDIDKLQNLRNKQVDKETLEKIQNRIHNINQIKKGLGAQINSLKLEELSQNEKKWFFKNYYNLSEEQLHALHRSKFFPRTVKDKIYKRINIISNLSNLINLPIRNLEQLKKSKNLSEQQRNKVEERIIIKNAIQTSSLPEEYMDRIFETATNRQKQILNGFKENYNDKREKSFIEEAFHNIRSFPDDMRSMIWHFDEKNQGIFHDIIIFILQKIGYINHRDKKIKLVLKGSRALQSYFENISTLDTDVILISENNEETLNKIMNEILSELQEKFSQTGTFESTLNQSDNTKKILWKPKGYNDDKNNVDIFDCFFKYEQLPEYYTTYITIGDNRNMLFYIESLENIKKEYTYLVKKYGGDNKDKFEEYVKKNCDKNLYSTFTNEERFNAFNYFKFKNRLEMIEKKEIENRMNLKK